MKGITIYEGQELKEIVRQALREELKGEFQSIDLASEKMTKFDVCQFISVSMPTLDKLIKAGKLKMYSMGTRKKYLLRSEVIRAMQTME